MNDERFSDPTKIREMMIEYYTGRLISEISTIAAIATKWMGFHKLRGAIINSITDCALEYIESEFKIMNYAFAKGIDFDHELFRSMMLAEIPKDDFDLEAFVSDIEMDLLLKRFFDRLKKEEGDKGWPLL